MVFKNNFVLFGLCILLALHHKAYAAASCGLVDVPDDTSPTNLYPLPNIPETLTSGIRIWENSFWGTLNGTVADSSSHVKYLAGSYLTSTNIYYIVANAFTKDFVREQGTRLMYRNITLKCDDETRSPKYHLVVMLQDVKEPVFTKDEYNLTISKDWDLANRPISDGDFIIVSDNDVLLENKEKQLQFDFPRGVVQRVEAHPLWFYPNPTKYSFLLDVYLNPETQLQAGQSFQVTLVALDDFNAGTTRINVNVSD